MSTCPSCGYPSPCGRCEEFFGYQWPHSGDIDLTGPACTCPETETTVIAHDRERMQSLRRWAQNAATMRGKRVELRRFHLVEAEIEVIQP